MNDITQTRSSLSSIGAPGEEPGLPRMLNAPGPSGEISGQSGPKLALFRPREPSPHAHATRDQHLVYRRSPSSPSLSPSPLLQPVPLTRTLPRPAFFSFPHPVAPGYDPFPLAALPCAAPHPVLPAPILLGRASPPVAAAARNAASAARSRAARAMAGGDPDSTPGLGARGLALGSPPRPGAPLAVPPSARRAPACHWSSSCLSPARGAH